MSSPMEDDSHDTRSPLLDIAQASTELDPTSCLITLMPFENGSVQICHLVSKELPQPKLNNLRNWWGHEAFRLNSPLNLITLNVHFHIGFDKPQTPQWTLIPTDEAIEDIFNFSVQASQMTVADRKKMYDKYDVRLTGRPNKYHFLPLGMLVGGESFLRRKNCISGSHPTWDTTTTLQARMEATRTEGTLDQYHFISSPFQHPSLESLTSHIHPFCVIMKASTVLSKSLQLLPLQLMANAVKIIAIGSRWSESFPTSYLRAVSSNRSPSTPRSDPRRSLRSAPYQLPARLPAGRIGAKRGGRDVTGGEVGANIGSRYVDALPAEEELSLAQNEESINCPQSLLESSSFDGMGSFESSDSDSELNGLDTMRVIQKVRPWRSDAEKQEENIVIRRGNCSCHCFVRGASHPNVTIVT